MRKAAAAFVLGICCCLVGVAYAQSTNAALTGLVTDPSKAVIGGAKVTVINESTSVRYEGVTNSSGSYYIPGLPPGMYRIEIEKVGFKTVLKPSVVLHVQDTIELNFEMALGSASETVTVEGGAPMINTTDASVSTVVDQSYVQNMPLNGRSFQDLILLTPGVVTQSSQSSNIVNGNAGLGMTGEFSVNGQREEANNYIVDGVSANLGAVAGSNMISGAGASGSVPAATALGTTQALVSVDDLQEFRVESSTYSAAYGRNPGGQFSFETKSGTNQWHGTAYDYLRNGYFDARDWFNDYFGVARPQTRQNDFGGTLGGPVRIPRVYNGKDKTFFFVSYEGLRVLAPQAATVNGVPDLCLRGQASACASTGGAPAAAALQPVLNAFPLPNGTAFGDGFAPYTASWTNPGSIDSGSARLDHVVSSKLRLFFRFSDTESNTKVRETQLGGVGGVPSNRNLTNYTTRTYTGGASNVFSSRLSNEFRINYSSNDTTFNQVLDAFGGSTPADLVQLTGLGAGSSVAAVLFNDSFTFNPQLTQGPNAGAQRQWNLTDTVGLTVGRHQFKFGADYRRLAPFQTTATPFLAYAYFGEASIESNSPGFTQAQAIAPSYPLYKNFSAFAEDEWKASTRLNLSMGLRWEVNPPPGVTRGLMPYTVSDPSTWQVAPQGTPLWKTTWYNFAPRLGAAYTLRDAAGWETVVRAGGGLFFDTGQQLGSLGFSGPGFVTSEFPSVAFPMIPSPMVTVEDPTMPAGQPYTVKAVGFPTNLQLPYTLQWNGSVEQALGPSQALTISYVGSHGARLLRTDAYNNPPANVAAAAGIFWVNNGLTSDYHSGQLQFNRRLSQGLTVLASYTYSHCIDYGSQNYDFGYQRGNCDSDVRHNFSSAFSYDLPNVGHGRLVSALVRHWGIDNRLTVRSAFPVTLFGNDYIDPTTGKTLHGGLNLIPNEPIYVSGAACDQVFAATLRPAPGGGTLGCPGGRAINPNAFALAFDAMGNPVVGSAPRNFARGFGAWQVDMAVRREFPIYENLKLQFRAEAFNIINHPNFGTVAPFYCSADPKNSSFSPGCQFGQPVATLSNSLGVLNSLYQMGGSRSMQFAVKLVF